MTQKKNEEQEVFEQIQEEARLIASKSSNEVEFMSQVAELPQVKKVFSSGQSVSGGITFSLVIDQTLQQKPHARTITIKKKF